MIQSDHQRTTADLKDILFARMDLLHAKKISPESARASASLAFGILGAANLEVVHHKLNPRRNGYSVKPVALGSAPQIYDQSKKKAKR